MKTRNVIAAFLFFLIVNFGMAPVVFVAQHKHALASHLEIDLFYITLLYGVYFIIAGACGRIFSILTRIDISIAISISAFGILSGALVVYIYGNVFTYFAVYILLFSAIGGAPLFSPLSAKVIGLFERMPTLAIATATVGQLTAFWFWGFISMYYNGHIDLFESLFVTCLISSFFIFVLSVVIYNLDFSCEYRPEISRTFCHYSELYEYFIYLVYFSICVTGAIFVVNVLSDSDNKYASAVFAISGIVGRLIVSYLYDKFLRDGIIYMSSTIFSVGLFMAFITKSSFGVLLCGVGYGAMLPVLLSHVGLVYYYKFKEVYANIFLYGSVGMLFGSYISGLDFLFGLDINYYYFLFVGVVAILPVSILMKK